MRKNFISIALTCTMLISAASCSNAKRDSAVATTESEGTTQTSVIESITEVSATTATDAAVTVAETVGTEPTTTTVNLVTAEEFGLPEVNSEYLGLTAEEICARMTLEEKAAQMMQGAYYKLSDTEMKNNCYGSVLSYQMPLLDNEGWLKRVRKYQEAALSSSTGIPFIYGNDCLHGINVGKGTVIFPHNINLGAANDVNLIYEMGVVTGSDMLHCGMLWNFSPCVASAQDPRWGRTYESYSSDVSILTPLAVSYTKGLMSQPGIIPCAKHFFGDGNTLFGTGEQLDGQVRLIDRGDAVLTDEEIQSLLSVYQALIDEGIPSIMLSHSALNGVKMHENSEYISYLRDEMGFEGVILSDWDSIHNCSGVDLKENVILSVNAGVDMFMEEGDYEECSGYIVEGVNEGSIPIERVNEAVTRIIKMKMDYGVFDDPYCLNVTPSYEWSPDYEYELARTLATESMVPLKLPDEGAIKLEAGMKVYVDGPAANDTGAMCGGWTYQWLGSSDQDYGLHFCTEGPSILEALKDSSEEIGFEIVTDSERMSECDVAVLCLGENTYAEWVGDAADISLSGPCALEGNIDAITRINSSELPTITLIIAGRNVIIDDYVGDWDEIIMCYLPGSEGGHAASDLLTGQASFSGHLPMPYYDSETDIGTDNIWLPVGFSAAD